MKKLFLFLLISILLLSLTVCEQPSEKKTPEVKLPSLTISNQSSFDLSGVTFSGILFSAQGSNDLPKGRQATRQLKENETGPAYINLTRKDIEISLRITDVKTFTETDTYTITDNTVVEEVGNLGNKGTLAQIAFQSKISVDYGGFSIEKNEAVTLEESIINNSRQNNFIIKNIGAGALTLTGTSPIRVEGEAGIFQVVQPSSQKIESGASVQFAISFNPKAEKTYTAIVTISSDNKDGNFTFTVTADGVPPKPIASVYYNDTIILQNGAINAGEVLITKSEIISIIIKNNGIEALTIDTANISITGANANAFTKVTNPLSIIPPGIQSAFEIECKPISYEDNNNIAILTIPTNDRSRNPVTVYLLMTVVRAYSVTFNADGGFPPPAVQSIESGGKVTEPEAMTRTGYTFNGWYKDVDYNNRWNFSFDTVTDTTTLYAQWIPVTYTVSYDKNASDALGTMTNIIHTYDVNKNLDINKFTRAGYNFIGWNTRADGQGVNYTDNQNVINLTSTADAVISLYAIWLQDINNVRVTAVAENSVSLAWDASAGASGYNIYRATGGAGIFNKINMSAVNTPEFIDTGVTPLAMVYYYKVSAVSSTGMEGTQSNPVPSANFIVPGNDLAAKLAWLTNNTVSNNVYFVEVDKNENIGPQTLSYSSRTDITIILSGRETMRTISLSSNGSLFTINSGVTLILDNNITLNGRSDNTASLVRISGSLIMHDGEITGNASSASGGGVSVENFGSFTMYGGEISGNTTTGGGGVYVSRSDFTMHGGEIFGNAASSGGGVHVAEGSFTMHGGEISGNTGAGLYGFNSIFIMYGGEISGNTGGGMGITSTSSSSFTSSSFTMYGGEISGNTGSGDGVGGVFIGSNSSFTMYGGEISRNTGRAGGVSVISNGSFTMYDGEVSGNTGIGVDVEYNSSFTMHGGNIFGNVSSLCGGIYMTSNSSFIMHGGKISGNTTTSPNNGGGVHMYNSGCSFTMYGGEISENTGCGVYVRSGGNFTMHDGEISGNTANSNGGGVYLGNNSILTMHSGEISGNMASDGGGVYLGGNSSSFTMHGGEISGNTANSDGGGVCIGNNGSFIMHGGEISGNTAVYGSGVSVENNSSFIMNGGEISGNKGVNGGGVYVYFNGSFTMHGGKISGNTADYYGGGVFVYNNSNFTMHGGEISGNTAINFYGGGVLVMGSFTMHGGEIFGNTANSNGGGVYMENNSTFYISEGVIYGTNSSEKLRNNAPYGSALYLLTGTFQYGRFVGDTFIPSGDLTTTNNTVRVVNGNLVTE